MDSKLLELIDCGLGHTTSVETGSSVGDAIRLMARAHVGAVVVRNGGDAIGIMTERDVVCLAASTRLDFKSIEVDRVMSAPVHTIDIEATVRTALRYMTQRTIRRLAVCEEGRFVALLSMSSLCAWMARDLEYEVEDLTNYICGRSCASITSLAVVDTLIASR